jgi:hypothetical protein
VDCDDPDCASDPACCVPVPEVCTDGVDNDCDRRVDCDDPDCASNPACCVPVPEVCTDGVDNDCDRRVDCDDPDCLSDPNCCVPSPEVCTDGVDNDCDGGTDCSDADCLDDPACITCRPEVCWDGVDNDCDTIVDCEDSDCLGHPSCEECFPEVCDDNLDNDCDGAVDCEDADCADDPYCLNRNDTCTDAREIELFGTYFGSTAGYANDYTGSCAGNGPDAVFYGYNATTRCVEIDTLGSSWDTVIYVRRSRCVGGTEIGCNDDYPGYGLQSRLRFDSLEPGLYFIFVDGWSSSNFGEYVLNVRECSAVREICYNGRDDDGDGWIDCEDPDCASDPNCLCEPFETSCWDGRDNDCDGMFDCEDPECWDDPWCMWDGG